ncbi:hypothetical protein [Brevibacillus porteri]|uniref:hypothetical protein n=1 Tax=Brevibacillus porteri TaxID=2126350 RepID=UPI003D1CE92B
MIEKIMSERFFYLPVFLSIILLFVIVTLGNNIVKHIEALHVIERSYVQMNKTSE